MKKSLRLFVALTAIFATSNMAFAAPSSGAALWLDASTGVQTDSQGTVTSWTDQSGNGHNAALINGGATVSTFGINSAATLNFNGGTRFDVGANILTSQQFSIFAVVSDQRTDGSYREIISNWGGGGSTSSIFFGTVGSQVRFSDYFDRVGSLTAQSSPFVLGAVNGSNFINIYQNDSIIASSNGALPTRNLGGDFYIGDQGTINGEYWQGTISEIIVYDRALTASEVTQTESYLNQKYFVAAASVPEPASPALLGLGLAGLVNSRRKARQA